MKHINLKITGRVQGVYYRASAKKQAEQLGIKGFVQNEPDGSVYAELEGEEEVLRQMVAWCYQGPIGAIVNEVKIREGIIQHFKKFEIRR